MMRKPLMLVAMAVPALAGCRALDPAPEPLSSPTVAAVEEAVRFHVHLGAGQQLATKVSSPDLCPGLDIRFDLGRGKWVRMVAFAVDCEPRGGDNRRPGNGNHGLYRSALDIPADRQTGTVATPLGAATTFEQPYYECTNSCRHFTEPVAVIALDKPAHPRVTALTVYSEQGTLDLDGLRALIRDQLSP
ncbi:hypothetical protein [Dactylosporangium matsuzakiense]|nr:hypothetical protein [Dactylosporangium matsuzakiense]UWZ41535.1 hypothetical protein Dmats_28195 [Dactylosporangium matsuzakiense]